MTKQSSSQRTSASTDSLDSAVGAFAIRRAEARDATWIHELAARERLEVDLDALLQFELARVFVVEPQLGFFSYWLVADEAQIQDLAVVPGSRRRGFGRALARESLRFAFREGATVATLEVRESNHAARAFYSALGFAEVGVRPRYYSNGEAARLLRLERDQAAFGDDDAPTALAAERANEGAR